MSEQNEGVDERKVVAQTYFTRIRAEDSGKQTDEWVWVTKAMNNETIANSESFKNVSGALNGFLSSQGFSDWTPGQMIPAGFSGFIQNDSSGNIFRIDHYETA